MSDIILSPANMNLIENIKNNAVKQTVDNKPKETNKKISHKKAICTIAAAVGTLALATVIIHKVARGKGAKEAQNVVKRFINQDGSEAVNVACQKGRLFSGDVPFNGTMQAVSKSGKKAKIAYQDGYIYASFVNNKPFKMYLNEIRNGNGDMVTISRDKGVRIFTFDKDNNIISVHEHTYYDSGKIKRLYTYDDDEGIRVKEFFDNKKNKHGIKAEARFKYNNLIEELKIYDEKGNVKLKGKSVPNNTDGKKWWFETHYDNGKKTKTKTGLYGYINYTGNADFSEIKLKKYDSVDYFDENANINKVLISYPMYDKYKLDYGLDGNKINYSVQNPTVDFAKELDINSGKYRPLCISVQGTDDLNKSISTRLDVNKGDTIIIPKFENRRFTQEELKELVVRLKEMLDIGRKEKIDFNSDYLERQIKAIEEYLQKA